MSHGSILKKVTPVHFLFRIKAAPQKTKMSLSFRKPTIFQAFSELITGESTRHGGVSQVPFASLNLGRSSGDILENVIENRKRFFGSLGIDLSEITLSHQVHGTEILVAQQPGNYEGYDAIITNQSNIFVAVSVADCTPILIYDTKNQVVAAIHAGWRGTVKQIVLNTLQRMEAIFGTNSQDCFAYVGTCIDECSFEVGDEVAVEFSNQFKRFDGTRQKYFIDLKTANVAQLLAFGVPNSQIEISTFSTVLNNEDYFSHRLEKGKTGRMMAVIGVRI